MILKTFNIATLLVVVWLLWNQAALQRAVSTANHGQSSIGQVLHTMRSDLQEIEEKLDNPAPVLAAAQVQAPAQPDVNQTAEINNLKAEIARYQSQIGQMHKSKDLKVTLDQVMNAELNKLNDSADAAEKLLATKEVIWRTRTEYKSVGPLSTYWPENGRTVIPTIRLALFIAYFPMP